MKRYSLSVLVGFGLIGCSEQKTVEQKIEEANEKVYNLTPE